MAPTALEEATNRHPAHCVKLPAVHHHHRHPWYGELQQAQTARLWPKSGGFAVEGNNGRPVKQR